jgi:hypothetical protein
VKRIFLLLVFIIPASSHAQYRGGSNDGVSTGLGLNENPLSSIYHGGTNDGISSAVTLNQNALTGIYTGGNNDGVSTAVTSNQNGIASIYTGGVNDGVAFITALSQNTLLNIYTGGLNDGVSSLASLNQNGMPGIYLGGINDGVSSSTVLNNNPLASIYLGGVNDGFASISISGVNSNTVPLPVTLLEFSGNWFNDDALLTWKTGIETELDHFELERSSDAGKTFEYIASRDPNPQPDQHDYRYTDVRAWYIPQDFLLYRLKSIDKTGKHFYSAVVKLSKDKAQPTIVVYPNPTSGHFTLAILNVSDFKGYEYLLTSADGKLIKKGSASEVNTSFDLSGFAAATYHLFLFKDGESNQHFTILLTQ